MKFQKIVNLLDTTSDDNDLRKFVTKKWINVYNQSGKNQSVNKEIRIKTSMLRSDLCDFSECDFSDLAPCGIITEMNQVVLFLLILNLLNTRQAL